MTASVQLEAALNALNNLDSGTSINMHWNQLRDEFQAYKLLSSSTNFRYWALVNVNRDIFNIACDADFASVFDTFLPDRRSRLRTLCTSLTISPSSFCFLFTPNVARSRACLDLLRTLSKANPSLNIITFYHYFSAQAPSSLFNENMAKFAASVNTASGQSILAILKKTVDHFDPSIRKRSKKGTHANVYDKSSPEPEPEPDDADEYDDDGSVGFVAMDADDMDDNSLKQNAEEEFERPRVSPHAITTSGSAPSRASSPELARGLVAQDTALSDGLVLEDQKILSPSQCSLSPARSPPADLGEHVSIRWTRKRRSSCSDLLLNAPTNMGSLSAKRLRSGPLSDFDDSSLLSSNMSPPSPLVSSHSPRPHAAAVTGSSTASNAHTLVDIASTSTRVSDLPDKLPCDAPPNQRRALVDLDLLLHGCESLNPGVKLNDMVINTLIQRLASAQVGVLNTFQICCQRTDSLRVRLQETVCKPVVLIPVHHEGHWLVCRWCEQDGVLEVFDSLRSLRPKRDPVNRVVDFLRWVHDFGDMTIQRHYIKCVQQNNSHDCGVYALKFADHIGTRAPLPQSLPRGGLADRCALGRALLSSWNAVLRPDEWGGTSDDVSATSTPGDRAGRLLDFMTSMSHYRHLMSRPQRGHATECSAVELQRLVHKETCWHQLQVLSDFIDEHHVTHKAALQHACGMANELRRGIDYKLQFTRQMLQGIDVFLNAYSNAKGSLGPHPWGSENQFARLIDATKNTATVAKECWDEKRQDDGFLAQRAAVQTAFGACVMHIVLLHKAVQKFRALAKAQPGGF